MTFLNTVFNNYFRKQTDRLVIIIDFIFALNMSICFCTNLILLCFVGSVLCSEYHGSNHKSYYDKPQQRLKRVIEYTRWRMATRTTLDFFARSEDLDSSKSTQVTVDHPHDVENVIIAGSIPKYSTEAALTDITTKDYTRFIIPTNTDAIDENYVDRGYMGSSIQETSVTVASPVSSTTEMVEMAEEDLGKDFPEIVGINQNAQHEGLAMETKSTEISYKVSHQVAPLAPITASRASTFTPLRPDSFERQPFSPAQPPLNRPIRTSVVPDIFVPTRMYITPITEDLSDFLAMTPDRTKYYDISSHDSIETQHRATQEDFSDLARTSYSGDSQTDTYGKHADKTTIQSDVQAMDGESPFRTEVNEKDFLYTTTESDNIEVKAFSTLPKEKDGDDIADDVTYHNIPTHTTIDRELVSENDTTTTQESDYSIVKESNIYQKEKDKDADAPSRLDQFYDHIYMKYEEPQQQVSQPRKAVIDKNEYEEEENELLPVKTTAKAYGVTMSAEMDSKVEEPAPFITTQAAGGDPDSGEEEESEEEDKNVIKQREKNAYVEPTENYTDLYQFTTRRFKPVTEQTTKKEHEITVNNGICSLVKLRSFDFKSARSLYEVNIQLQMWSQNQMVKVVDITNGNLTHMENPINMVIVDDSDLRKKPTSKVTVMIIAGVNGRDHHAVSSALYFLYQLIDKSDLHRPLLSRYRFWVIPVVNPDGYHYSTTFAKQRHWVKNLHQYFDDCKTKECETCLAKGFHCKLKLCYGVNLDRNFAYQWIPPEEAAAEHSCGMFYAGESYLSEPESQALSIFLKEQMKTISLFFALKEGDVLGIMYPYSYTRKKRTFASVFKQNAFRAASAASEISGRQYVAGQMSDFIPLFSGGIEDWVDHNLGIDNIFTVMMYRQSDANNTSISMERVDREAFAALDTILMRNLDGTQPPMQLKHQVSPSNANSHRLQVKILSFDVIPSWEYQRLPAEILLLVVLWR